MESQGKNKWTEDTRNSCVASEYFLSPILVSLNTYLTSRRVSPAVGGFYCKFTVSKPRTFFVSETSITIHAHRDVECRTRATGPSDERRLERIILAHFSMTKRTWPRSRIGLPSRIFC